MHITADNILFFFMIFRRKIRLDIPCDLSAKSKIIAYHMLFFFSIIIFRENKARHFMWIILLKCLALFSLKMKKKKKKNHNVVLRVSA